MDSPLSPSKKPMTDGQIGKVWELLESELFKHRAEFPSNIVQAVLAQKGAALQYELLFVFRKFVELLSSMIVRIVLVKYNRSPREAIVAPGFRQHLEGAVVASMPGGGSKNQRITVYFFNVGRRLTDDELEKEYEIRGLIPADPYILSAVNEADKAFADEHPNVTHWKNDNGDWCCANFSSALAERWVGVYHSANNWHDYWWFAGVPRK